MIVNPNTHQPEAPAEIVRRLQQVDPRLGLHFGETVDPATDRIRPAWMLTMDWLPDDKRHRLVQEGKFPLDSCYDCLAFLPFDCGVDEAYGYVVKTFRQMNEKPDVKRMLDRVHTYNRQQQAEVMKETVELGLELAEANRHRVRSHATRKNPVERPGQTERNLRDFLDR